MEFAKGVIELIRELERLVSIKEKVIAENAELKKRVEETKKNEDLVIDNNALKEQIKVFQSIAEGLRSGNEMLRMRLDLQIVSFNQMKERAQELERQLNEERPLCDEDLVVEIDRLEEQVNTLVIENNILEHNIEGLKDRLETSNNKCASLENQIKELEGLLSAIYASDSYAILVPYRESKEWYLLKRGLTFEAALDFSKEVTRPGAGIYKLIKEIEVK